MRNQSGLVQPSSLNGTLKYAWHDGANWHIETVDSGGDVGQYNSLVLDTAGRPHISYYRLASSDLKYAWFDGMTWHIATIDPYGYGNKGEYNSLALDKFDQPHFAYCGYRDLQYVQLPAIALTKEATPSQGLLNSGALTYTLVLSGSGLSVELWDPLPEGVHYISDSITGNVTPLAIYSPTARAVIWEGVLASDTAQVIRFQVTPGITGTGALSLSQAIVNTAWLTDTEYNRSVSATVIVNGKRVYLPVALLSR